MNMNVVTSLLSFIGGIGMFIYGMDLMGDGLQQAAGEKTRHLLEILTNNRLMGVLTGALITAVIQSSGATTVMVVGFVNAGLMNLSQAVGVIMGANIGTTMTAWIVSMGEWAAFLQPEMMAPVLLVVGLVMLTASKGDRSKNIGKIFIGFGLLFSGLSIMTGAAAPYADAPIFTTIFTAIGSNPIFGLLAGLVVTAVMQSSSASMGILQTLAITGIVNWGSAVFIALGQNIGTCMVAIISAVGADRNAKRAAMIHLEFNVIGSIIVGFAAWIYFMMNPAMVLSTVTSTTLAIFHTSFNVVTTILLFPFANQLVGLSGFLVPKKGKEAKAGSMLDERMLKNPSFALVALRRELLDMGKLATENIRYSRDALLENKHYEKLAENETLVDSYYKAMMSFISRLPADTLTSKEQLQVKHLILAIRDIEHVSDRCKEIANIAQANVDYKKFSSTSIEDINTLSTQCAKAMEKAMEIYKDKTVSLVPKVDHYEEEVDNLEKLMREGHIARLIDHEQDTRSSIVFLEAVDCYERIADHAKLLAHYVLDEEMPAAAAA